MCEHCEDMVPIKPYCWDVERAGTDPCIYIERCVGIGAEGGHETVVTGYFTNQFEDLEPDAYFNFEHCPKCGRDLRGDQS